MSYGSSCLIVVSVGRKEQLLGCECRAHSPECCLHHLSAPCQLGSSWSAHCSREISWEEVQGKWGQQGNQLGQSRRGAGSGQQAAAAAPQQQQSSASDVPPLPVPTSTAMQDREGLHPPTATSQHEKHKSDRWGFILTLAPSAHGWAHPHARCSSCSLLLLHGNNLCQNVWLVSPLPGVCLRLTPGSKDRQTFEGTKRVEWL